MLFRSGMIEKDYPFTTKAIGKENAKIINNLTVDIIENSYGKDYILLSGEAFHDLSKAKEENNTVIYKDNKINAQYNDIIKPMFKEVYYKLLSDIEKRDENSILYKHHINPIGKSIKEYQKIDYLQEEKNQIVVDYIASMTDDYFISLHEYLFQRPGAL